MEPRDYDHHPEVYRTERKQRKETEVKFLKTQQIRANNDERYSIQYLCQLAGIYRPLPMKTTPQETKDNGLDWDFNTHAKYFLRCLKMTGSPNPWVTV